MNNPAYSVDGKVLEILFHFDKVVPRAKHRKLFTAADDDDEVTPPDVVQAPPPPPPPQQHPHPHGHPHPTKGKGMEQTMPSF